MKRLLTALIGLIACGGLVMHAEEAARLAGSWQMAVETPHGPMQGALEIKQDGAKLSGTLEMEHFGTLALSGQVEGRNLSFSVDIQGHAFTFSGAADAGKMAGTTDPMGGAWTATRK